MHFKLTNWFDRYFKAIAVVYALVLIALIVYGLVSMNGFAARGY